MKKITFLSLLLLLNFCSNTPESIRDLQVNKKLIISFDEKAILYPAFNIKFAAFGVADADPNFPDPNGNMTDEHKRRARIFNTTEKRHMLRNLDFIRFVVNTPEFEEKLLATTMYLARGGTGPLGSSKVGDRADNKRVLDILRHATYTVTIRKQAMADYEAVAVVGPNRYQYPPKGFKTDYSTWLAFPNHKYLDQGSFINDSYYRSGILFHEVMHNLGFTHNAQAKPDVVCETSWVYKQLARDKNFLAKYSQELARFRPFYEGMHSDWLVSDTIPATKKFNSFHQNHDADDIHIHGTEDNDDDIICVVQEDGSYEMITVKEYKKRTTTI